MKIAISTVGTFHAFDLARELHGSGVLARIFSGYPRFKLQREALPQHLVDTFPWIHAPYMAFPFKHKLGLSGVRAWERLDLQTLDAHVATRLRGMDVLVGMSGSGLQSGRAIKAHGGRYVCDRGSTHIRVQDHLVRDEERRWGAAQTGVDPWVMDREEAEYAEADCITVPSSFNVRSFIEQGVPADKLRKLPYGVNLSKFHPTQPPGSRQFDVLFAGGMSLRKGIPYLLQAYKALKHPRKSLTMVGTPLPSLIDLMRKHGLWSDDIKVLGHVDQSELKHVMSRSHVLLLPSIEEGLALVQAQAMACGCPVIATENTGSEDLFEHGVHGYITPVRRVDLMTEYLQRLADDEGLRQQLSSQALEKVKQAGGFRDYGLKAQAIYKELL